jgi:hypothetical protein
MIHDIEYSIYDQGKADINMMDNLNPVTAALAGLTFAGAEVTGLKPQADKNARKYRDMVNLLSAEDQQMLVEKKTNLSAMLKSVGRKVMGSIDPLQGLYDDITPYAFKFP